MNLIRNEIIKIMKRKSTLFLLLFILLSLFLTYGITYISMHNQADYQPNNQANSMKIMVDHAKRKLKYSQLEQEKKELSCLIDVYEYAISQNIDIGSPYQNYKSELIKEILVISQSLSKFENSILSKEYIAQKNEIDNMKQIVETNDYEEYIQRNKDTILQEYLSNNIDKDTYTFQIEQENVKLKYEINKELQLSTSWKIMLLEQNEQINIKLLSKFDFDHKQYLNENRILRLTNQKEANLYRLEHNIPTPYNMNENKELYFRWTYDNMTISVSTFLIAIVFVLLACTSISDEISKGTIKFLLMTPFKRYQIILAKFVAHLILLIATILITSQLTILLGNTFFPGIPDQYVAASHGTVTLLSTHTYLTVQYLLQIPEILFYLLLGMSLSTLFRNSTLSCITTLILYLASPTVLSFLSNALNITTTQYLPFSNFDFNANLLPVYNNFTSNATTISANQPILFSMVILTVTGILLLLTTLEDFSKRDILS